MKNKIKNTLAAIVLAGTTLFSPINADAQELEIGNTFQDPVIMGGLVEGRTVPIYFQHYTFTSESGEIVFYKEFLGCEDDHRYQSFLTILDPKTGQKKRFSDDKGGDLLVDEYRLSDESGIINTYSSEKSMDELVIKRAQEMFDDYLLQIRELRAEQSGL